MKTPFTPGPWIDGECSHPPFNFGVFASNQKVAEVPLRLNLDRKEAKANARLIAAAPEMYEALNEIFNELDGRYDGAPDSRVLWMGEHITHIRAALAKAVQP